MNNRFTSINLIVYPGFKSFEAVGPITVFDCANRYCKAKGIDHQYDLTVYSEGGGPTKSDSIVCLDTQPLTSVPPDTCLVAGSPEILASLLDNGQIVNWLRRHASRIRRCAGLCTGAFFLAEAGLLKNQKATTHWRYAPVMQERYPEITILSDSIFIQAENVWTSAGVSAAIDLCLAFVEQDCGHEVALYVARELVIYLRRPGGQSQFAGELAAKLSSQKSILDIQAWILSNLDKKITIAELSAMCRMSIRTFRRIFHQDTGKCPTEFITQARPDKARVLLRDSPLPIKSIAFNCGFPSDDQMRSSFKSSLQITPKEYRERFSRQHLV